jgi:hypothetical protein
MRKLSMIIATAFVATLVPVLPAHAATATITSPADGQTFTTDQNVRITASLDEVDSACPTLEITISGPGQNDVTDDWDTAASTTYDRVWSGFAPGNYTITVAPPPGVTCTVSPVTVSFSVVMAGPTLGRVSARPTPFFPYVNDGYRDTTKVMWAQDQRATVRLQVRRTSTGKLVRSVSMMESAGRHAWNWGGRNNRGKLVDKGRYSITVAISNANGSDSDRRRVRTKTGWVSKNYRKERTGRETSSRSGASCHWDTDNGALGLDSWGGYCQAVYRFAIPARAVDVHRSISTRQHPLDFGPGTGTISKWWSGNAAYVRVTGWRAHTVVRVAVTYKTRRRI